VTITLKEFQAFAQQRISEGIAEPEKFPEKFREVMDFAVANEASMDAEANAFYNRFMDGMASFYEQGLSKIADSPERRKMLRLAGLIKQKHHKAENFLKGLGRPLPKPFPIAEAAKPIFLEALQSVLDLLFDATRVSQNGVAQFATLSMLYWTVDELNVAFYLAERKYTTQAYSHLRTVHDLLEKAELFFLQPQWADVWRSDDKKKIIRELSPGAVREKLGKAKFDPTYSFLTEMGMHGTFGAVRKRVVQREKVDNRTQIGMWIGGVPFDEEVDAAISASVISVISVLIMVARVYHDRLNVGEVTAVLPARTRGAMEFLQKHLIEPRKNAGIDVSGFEAIFKQLLASMREIRSNVPVAPV
jgi:hypothetical protein